MRKYTERIIDKLISKCHPSKKVAMWVDGKFYACYEDSSKSKNGIKFNRLIRIRYNLKIQEEVATFICC